MSKLIIPAAGLSTRFPNVRPKWMLTHPQGKSMLYHSVAGLNLDNVDEIIITTLQEYEDQYGCTQIMEEILKLHPCVRLLLLDQRTKSQVETVLETIKTFNITGQISINDTDNFFTGPVFNGNYVGIVDLHKHVGHVNVSNKSYVIVSDFGNITNIVEKVIISHQFCCGLYGFKYAEEFEKYSNILGTQANYISEVIYHGMINGLKFNVEEMTDYIDWGTLEDWLNYKNKFKTYFIDFDGTLCVQQTKLDQQGRQTTIPIKANVEKISKLSKSGFAQIIITTSRPYKDMNIVVKFLEDNEIFVKEIIMDCLHSQRVLINDFAPTNPYKSAEAINIVRNSNDLVKYL